MIPVLVAICLGLAYAAHLYRERWLNELDRAASVSSRAMSMAMHEEQLVLRKRSLDAQERKLGPVEALNTAVEYHRDRADVLSKQVLPLKRVAVAAQELVGVMAKADGLPEDMDHLAVKLHMALGKSGWKDEEVTK
jgi:hypothetical protein